MDGSSNHIRSFNGRTQRSLLPRTQYIVDSFHICYYFLRQAHNILSSYDWIITVLCQSLIHSLCKHLIQGVIWLSICPSTVTLPQVATPPLLDFLWPVVTFCCGPSVWLPLLATSLQGWAHSGWQWSAPTSTQNKSTTTRNSPKSTTICDRICQNPTLTHTMAKNIFHHQSIALLIS